MTKIQKLAEIKKTVILRKKVGKSLRAWRLGECLVMTQVASKVKVSQGSLSDLENGKCLPSFQTVFMLKKKFPDTNWDDVLFN